MAGASGEGLLRVSRRADQLPGIARLPSPRHGLMAAHATAPQPEGSHDVAADREDRIRLSPAANNPSSVAADALCRHTPKVGAACGNSARAVLCGGRSVTTVPTANEAVRVLQRRMSGAPRKRQAATRMRPVVQGHNRKSPASVFITWPRHSHDKRPANIYIVSGSITEYRSTVRAFSRAS